ncbi:hypothetical protein [Streptomyces sp. NRRL S-495]|uniref:hypothetical protein n=1 Tax=Streptomyces sp. NRRL S-495 TaxID=1609133 RepID=UPI0005F902AB|nr:hypothetical protein [Streptomyces sp. NRRL S-495]KJY26434.1 hypothetical protein VR45_37045 [Streptomyces sp. NRRL S-495]
MTNDIPVRRPSAYTDAKGRGTWTRIAEVQRGGDPITTQQRIDAAALLDDLLAAAAKHDITLDDLDWTIDLPGGCIDVITAKARKR